MSKRKVVKINVELCVQIAKKKHWKAVDLSAMVGKHKNWLSEVKRGRNLPSPEEAARMCAILNVTPEEILLEQADIDMVRGLIESQRTEQEKMPTPEDELEQEFVRLWRKLAPEERDRELAYIRELAEKNRP